MGLTLLLERELKRLDRRGGRRRLVRVATVLAFVCVLLAGHSKGPSGPLVFVLGINAAKEAFDDLGRHRSDAAVNKRPALTIVTKRVPSEQVPSADDDFARQDDAPTRDAESGNGSEKNEDDENDETRERVEVAVARATWRDLRVGDVVLLRGDDEIPALSLIHI